MSELEFKEDIEGDKKVLSFSGSINENVQFPEIDLSGHNYLILDMQSVVTINSIGIKKWVEWINPLAKKIPEGKIELRRCPQAIINQINMVKNFLPGSASVSSFYTPLFCERCDKEDSVLIDVATEVIVSGGDVEIKKDLAKSVDCKEASCEMDFDVIAKKYFGFLQPK